MATTTSQGEVCKVEGACTRNLTLLLQYKTQKLRRDNLVVSSLPELEAAVRRELQIPDSKAILLRYFDADFDELVDLESLSILPDKAKLQVIDKDEIAVSAPSTTVEPAIPAPSQFGVPQPGLLIDGGVPPGGLLPPPFPGGNIPIELLIHLQVQQQLAEQGILPPPGTALPFPPVAVPLPPQFVPGPAPALATTDPYYLQQLQQLQYLQQQEILQRQFQEHLALNPLAPEDEDETGLTTPILHSGNDGEWLQAKPREDDPGTTDITMGGKVKLSPIQQRTNPIATSSAKGPPPVSESPKVPEKKLQEFLKSCSFSPLKQSIVFKLYQDMRDKGVRDYVKDHKQLFKTFPKTISGEDLVSFLISKQLSKDVPEAMNVAQQLINFDILIPVTDKTTFKAFKVNLYRFHEDAAEVNETKGAGPSVNSLRKNSGAVCGYIFKKSGLRFTKRYLVIRPEEAKLYIFKTRYDSSPRQTIALADVSLYLRGSGEVTTGFYSFTMSSPTFTYVLAAKKQSDQEAWIVALQSAGALFVDDSSLPASMPNVSSIYDFTVDDIDGNPFPLSNLKGKVCLIVNVASKCGLTCKTYKGLQDLYERNSPKGFVILGFPCNQFGRQEPGTNIEIKTYVRTELWVTFPLFAKIKVNGEKSHPLYKYLRASVPGILGDSIKWNFTKFLINTDGVPIKRFSPATKASAIEPHILQLFFSQRDRPLPSKG